jgi:hypothetical protein
MTNQVSTVVELGIPGLALLVVALVGVAVFRFVGPRPALWFGLGTTAWLGLTAVLGLSGFLSRFEGVPPPIVLLLGPTLGLPLWLGFSRTGAQLARAPLGLLVGFHAFRFPLELVMHEAAAIGLMPPQMTYTGWNFDITSGIGALLVAALIARGRAPRWLLLAWNAWGTLLLLAIVIIAVASLPMFGAFGSEPASLNTWVAYFPFVWLPAGMVSAAVLGHVVLWRRLLSYGMRGRDFAVQSSDRGRLLRHG